MATNFTDFLYDGTDLRRNPLAELGEDHKPPARFSHGDWQQAQKCG